MIRVALYVRVSTDEQAEEGFSIDAQILTLREHCKAHNYEVFKIYKDEGFSGKSLDRPDLQELIHHAEQRLFDKVMVYNISRLSRKQIDCLNLIDRFKTLDIHVYSIKEGVDTSTPMGNAMLQIASTFAELDRARIIDNCKLGMMGRAREGLWNGGTALGYKSEAKRLVVVEDEANIVRYIFNLYLSGKGYKSIAHTLNQEGYKSKKGVAFSINSVRTILSNPLYAGLIRFNKQEHWEEKRRSGTNPNPIVVEGKHEPIISKETWEKTRELIQMKSYKPVKTFTGYFPLTTLLRCPVCGQGMIGQRSKRNKKNKDKNDYIRYYMCGNAHYKGSSVCRTNLVRADYAEDYVYKKFNSLATDGKLLQSVVNAVNENVKSIKDPLLNQQRYLDKEIAQNKKNQEKYMQLYEKDIRIEIVANKLKSLDEEMKKLRQLRLEVEAQLQEPTIEEISFYEVYDVVSSFNLTLPSVSPEKQKQLLHSLISKISINPSDKIEERSIKDIELVFDASLTPDYVLTYDTVPPG